MTEWMLRKQQLCGGEVYLKEHQKWKPNWLQTVDDCGKFRTKKAWRKNK